MSGCWWFHRWTPWKRFTEFDGIRCDGKVRACVKCGKRQRKLT